MKRQAVSFDVGFADAEFASYARTEDVLVVTITAWTDERLVLTFRDVLEVVDRGVGDISAVCEVVEPSALLEGAVGNIFEGTVPQTHPYRHYQILDNDDNPTLEVIAGSLDVRRGGQ